jgi:dTDP-4-amino-4,6-dideoxygalactose transaminase
LIPYGRQSINFWDVYAVVKQLGFQSLTQGHRTIEFEEYAAEYCGAKYAVAVSSATAGLQIALNSLELPENSTVATSPISFVASSNSILYNNLKPYFVDIDRENGNISIEKLTELLQSGLQISAIVPVHFAGQSCNMLALKELSNEYNFKIIEDAAHALGGHHQDGSKDSVDDDDKDGCGICCGKRARRSSRAYRRWTRCGGCGSESTPNEGIEIL